MLRIGPVTLPLFQGTCLWGVGVNLIPYSSVIEGDKHAGIGIIQLSGYCGLCKGSGQHVVMQAVCRGCQPRAKTVLCPVCWPEQNNMGTLHEERAQIAIAPLSSRPIKWRVFLPVSMPMVCATVAAVL